MTSSPALTDAFRNAMRRLSAGVVMVTTRIEDQAWGLTVSACCSVSVDPALMLVSVGAKTTTATGVREDSRFGVSILGEQLLEVAHLGSARKAPKFVTSFCLSSADLAEQSRTPVLDGCLAHVDCRLVREIEAGDHAIFLGEVEHVLSFGGDGPLVYFDGAYRRLGERVEVGSPVLTDTVDSMLYPHPIPLDFHAAAI
jgi:flavin reductase (DIM6/NTAB) family NADH-FMN oxidoreductase RutF